VVETLDLKGGEMALLVMDRCGCDFIGSMNRGDSKNVRASQESDTKRDENREFCACLP